MAAYSGKNGTVTIGGGAVAQITKWTLEESVEVDKFGHSGSQGRKDGVAGCADIKGSFEAKLSSGGSPPAVGNTVTLALSDGQTTRSGQAIIQSVSVECDIDTGKAVSFSANFEGILNWS